jgi:5-methylcytosine-specific restriction endonuclease McrA
MAKSMCSVESCEKPHSAKGFCPKHYQRWKRHGDPTVLLPKPARGQFWVPLDAILVCKKCGESKQASEFPPVPDNRSGRSGSCHSCWNAYVSERYATASPERRATLSKRAYEWKKNHPEVWKAQARRHYEKNRNEVLARVSDYASQNREAIKLRMAEYMSRPEVKKAHALNRAEWIKNNPERVAFHRRKSSSNRRARMRGVQSVSFTLEQLEARIAAFGGLCWMCGGAYEHLDHVKPVKAGGPHMLSNIRPACGPCNMSKSGKWEGPAWARSLAS